MEEPGAGSEHGQRSQAEREHLRAQEQPRLFALGHGLVQLGERGQRRRPCSARRGGGEEARAEGPQEPLASLRRSALGMP